MEKREQGKTFGSMADQLRNLGLISEKTRQEAAAEQELREKFPKKSEISSGEAFNNLLKAESIKDFKFLSQQVLAENPEKMRDIVNLAHQIFPPKGDAAKKRFIAGFMFLKDVLTTLDNLGGKPKEWREEMRNRIVKKELSKSGPTFDLPRELQVYPEFKKFRDKNLYIKEKGEWQI